MLPTYRPELLALPVGAFQGVFTHFFALFGVVQRHNKFLKSLMEIPQEMPNLSIQKSFELKSSYRSSTALVRGCKRAIDPYQST
jgi:hypothetical protein